MADTVSTTRPVPLVQALLAAALAAAMALAAAPLGAQDTDARWLPWIGCWEAAGEGARDDGLLCVRPAAADAGVEVVAYEEGEVVETRFLSADGRRTQTTEEGCNGWHSGTFSEDGFRVFVQREETCEGGNRRASTGLIAMTSPYRWIEVQAVDVGDGRSVAWVQSYELASPERVERAGLPEPAAGRGRSVEMARMAASASAGPEDVIEATRQVGGEAVKAWVAELGQPMDLDAETLVAMADAGVPGSVIDVVVAMSYPERFAVDRREPERGRHAYDDGWGYRPRGWFGRAPYYGYGRYSPYYSPFGFGGGFYGGGFYGPRVIVVRPRDGGDRGGRVVNGRGYTRGGRGAPSAGSSRSGGSRPAVRGGSSSGGRKAKPRKPPSGSGESRPSARSSGSSGSSSGSVRKAKPRKPPTEGGPEGLG